MKGQSDLIVQVLGESARGHPRLRALALALVAAGLLGAPCRPGGLGTIVVDQPLDGALLDDPGGGVSAAARVGTNFDTPTLEVRLDGVDLLAALGLVPPFSGAGGTVALGPDLVTLSDFSFRLTNPRQIDFTASGLPLGAHLFEVEGEKTSGGLVADAAGFDILEPFAQAAHAVPAGGSGPRLAGTEGTLFTSSVAQPLAAPPVGLAGGGTLRSGFVEVSEALLAAP
jgi:hypothetical protein